MSDLTGKVALITGAARGQGRAHAQRLASEGAAIIALDLCDALPKSVKYRSSTTDDLDKTVALVEELGGRVIPIVADVRDFDAMKSSVDDAVEKFGGLDIVVANAGIAVITEWDQITPAAFRDTIDINLIGVWNTVMVGAPHLQKRPGGCIVLASSAAGVRVQPFMIDYVASKYAVTGMAKAFAAELAKDNIRVNSIHPTGVNTEMATDPSVQEIFAAATERNPRPASLFTNMLDVDLVEPSDVANTVAYLVSEEARFITGHAMTIDAGITLH
ncbi:mycofactocin-coupled SDR family oxidoreductase (plasmid) [Rhodococcus sp. USK10]|uniref:mycofactocin-coupled SDR family oxidoreductase n=1 Tax=Rhodococcus sp. USK10 TaxID=2789739 RepID=UPI001C5D987F|nr:mycofactocin-coupled SDR family oxidoreductase [Rhodococcus sp. USK10]QYB00378.1 mycofactocin-coupled SDR family oxidoreductase [Rhodococcus sp. USK10]